MSPLQYLHNMIPLNVAGLSFIYVLLPFSLLLFYLAPKKLRPAVLVVASLGFYALSQPERLWIIVLSAAVDYALLRGVCAAAGNMRAFFLWICVIKNLGLIVFFGAVTQISLIQPPLGAMVYCVSGIYAVLEAYRAEEYKERGAISFAAYMFFSPRLYVGPLSKYSDFSGKLDDLEFDAKKILTGFGRFVQGALKYAVLGRNLFALYTEAHSIPQEELSFLGAWALVLSFALALYFTFSGLCDMARGASNLFGFDLPQNFYYPYQSRSVMDFMQRFNMTVSVFIRQAVYEPMREKRPGILSDALILLVGGMLSGIWFGLRINYMVWGAALALFVIMEKYAYPGLLKRVPTLFCRGYAFCVVLLSFTVFAGDSLIQSGRYAALMFGMYPSAPIVSDRILYLLSSNWLLFAVGCFLATNAVSLFTAQLRKLAPRLSAVAFFAADCVILAVYTALSLGGGQL